MEALGLPSLGEGISPPVLLSRSGEMLCALILSGLVIILMGSKIALSGLSGDLLCFLILAGAEDCLLGCAFL